jgi:hypothetical protein
MRSGSSLINASNANVVQNPNSTDSLYNPNIPVKGSTNNYSKFNMPSHNIKLKSQYYKQMLLGNNIKNGSTYTLGANSKGLNIFQDYDRAIDSNMMRRRDPNNNKQTIANDYETGSYDAYYTIPITTKPVTKINVGADPLIKSLNQQTQYKNRFEPTASNIDSIPTDVEPPLIIPKTRNVKPQHNVNQLSGIGTDPTEDQDYIRMKAEMQDDREQSLLNRNARLNQRTNNVRDKYSNPVIRSGTFIKPTPIRRPLNINPL